MFNIDRIDENFIRSLGIEGKYQFHIKGGFVVNTKSHAEPCQKIFRDYLTKIKKTNESFGVEAITITYVAGNKYSIFFEIDSDFSGIDPNHPSFSRLLPDWKDLIKKLLRASPKISLNFEVYHGIYRVHAELEPWQDLVYQECGYHPLFFTYVPVCWPLSDTNVLDVGDLAYEDGVYIFHKAAQTECCIIETMDKDSYEKSCKRSIYRAYWKVPGESKFKYTTGIVRVSSGPKCGWLESHRFAGYPQVQGDAEGVSFWTGK